MQDSQQNASSKPACRQSAYRMAACQTARIAAFHAAAADERTLYWQLLHLSHLLSPDAVPLPHPGALAAQPPGSCSTGRCGIQ